MPIYEYTCPLCNITFEEWIKSASDTNADHYPCPECKGEAQRMMSPSTFILKGGGWYVTEYSNKNADPEQKPVSAATDTAEQNAEQKQGTEQNNSSAPKEIRKEENKKNASETKSMEAKTTAKDSATNRLKTPSSTETSKTSPASTASTS